MTTSGASDHQAVPAYDRSMVSDGSMDAALRTMHDQFAVGRLQAAYGDAVSRQAWDEVAAMFAPDCLVHLDVRDGTTRTISGGEAMAAFIATSIERFEFFEFALLNSVVEISADIATGRLYMWELRQDRGTGRWSNAYGLYRDRSLQRDGRWLFAERQYSSLARTAPDGDGMLVFPIPGD
jgi:hypothetical protein